MNRKKQSLVVVALVIFGLVEFGAAVADPSIAAQVAGAARGFYVISCLMEPPPGFNVEPCLANNEIPLGTALVLNSHVTDSAGTLAKNGTLLFQDCSLSGNPAPSVNCDSGSGHWSNIQTVHMNGPGDIRIGYGSPSTAQTIGFRFRYVGGQASGIANDVSNSLDVIWF